jgi:hypothetical protein
MIRFSLSGWSKLPKRRATSLFSNPNRAKRFVPGLELLEVRTVPSYVFSTLDDPSAAAPAGGLVTGATAAVGINARDQIVGTYADTNFEFHGFLLSRGQYQTIDDPSPNVDPFMQPNGTFGINARGQIVGTYTDSNSISHGYFLSNGQFTTLDDPNAPNNVSAATTVKQGTVAEGINEQGQIVGFYYDIVGAAHGFLLSGYQWTTLDKPGAGTSPTQGTYAFGINVSGQTVGQYVGPDNSMHGFLFSGGQYTTLDDPSPDVTLTAAQGINDRGQIVGYYADAVTVHGFVLSGGTYTTLDFPGAGIGGTQASGINSSGKIVGFYVDMMMGVQHGFLATPDRGGHASYPGGHGGDRLGDVYTAEITTASAVQCTINPDQAPSPSCRATQGIGTSVEIFFASRLIPFRHSSVAGNDLFGSNDEIFS